MRANTTHDQATTSRLVKVLEAKAKNPTLANFRRTFLDAMGLLPEASVVDLGCGTGVVARALVQDHGLTGRILGIDQDPVLLEAARSFASENGVGDQIEFREGNIEELDLPDASFDAATAQTSISHTPNPETALKEAARILIPGGVFGLFDGDHETLTFGCPDKELGRKMEREMRRASGHGRFVGDLPRLLSQAGFDRILAIPFVYLEVGAGGYWLDAANKLVESIGGSEVVTAAEIDRWLDGQKAASDNGTFFASCNYYAYIAQRA